MVKKISVFLIFLSFIGGQIVKASQGPTWLKNAIFYQVYPTSFKDSDGNGIGDLKGIEDKLDYIKSIGVNTIWFNPVFETAHFDGGYDITDFYKVDPRLGTNDQLIALINKAHSMGMRVCMDLVAGHTSDKHPWFIQSKQKDNNLQYSDYFIWTNSKEECPKKFVKSDAAREGNYMKNYFDCQPALNYGFANPDPAKPWQQSIDAPGPQAVRREMKNIISFWMDKGVDGFRVDMAHSLIKNDKDYLATKDLWAEIGNWFKEKYPEGALISEWGEPHKSIPGGFNIDFMFHIGTKGYRSMFFNRDKKGTVLPCYFEKEGRGSSFEFLSNYQKEYDATKEHGYISIPTSNHDIFRLACASREDNQQLKVAMTFLLSMPGIPFIYYGDEIGMRYIDNLPDIEGSMIKSRNRAGCRTPMQWNDTKNAGFSNAAAEKLYIALDPNDNRPTVAQQENDPNSILNYVRQLIELRQDEPAMGNTGTWRLISDINQPYPMIYLREAEGKQFCVAINPTCKNIVAKFTTLGEVTPKIVIGDKKTAQYKSGKLEDSVKMKPVTAVVFEL